jgi:hypothetical protein
MPTDLVFKKYDPNRPNATPGRYVTGALFPGVHGAVAGKKGHKLKAAGLEVGGGMLVPTVGSAAATHYGQKSGWYKKQVKKSMDTMSYWGIDHGEEIGKGFDDPNPSGRRATTGRKVLAAWAPGWHAAFAAKRGKKLRSVGNEAVGGYGGGYAGGVVGGLAAAATRKPALARGITRGGQLGGQITGALAGQSRNQRQGYLKKQSRGAL